MKDKLTGKINNETLTRGIKHWGLGGYSSILPRIKFGVTGQDISPQSPTVSYRKTLWPIKKQQLHKMTRTLSILILIANLIGCKSHPSDNNQIINDTISGSPEK